MKKLLSLLLFSGAVLPVLAGALEIGFDKGTNPGWGFFQKPVPFGKLTIKLASWDYNAIVIRLVDSTGQTHQMPVWFRSGGKWKDLSIELPKWSRIHWGGANDGKWHGNLKSVIILVEGNGLVDRKKGQGFLYLNRIAIEAP